MQQTVRLLGDLGERYGSEHKYHDLRTPADAIKLLCINYPALQKELTEAHLHGVGYTLVQAETFLGYEDLQLPLGRNDLVLTPVIAGSGGSTSSILIGVGLVAFAIVTAGAGTGFLGLGAGLTGTAGVAATATTAAVASTGFVLGSAASVALGAIGTSLILSGVSQMLAPQPIIPSLGSNRSTPGENTNATGPQGVSRAVSGQQSYAFSGPANTVGVGATVPIVYGKLLVGSHLISARVEVAEESDPTSAFFTAPGQNTITVNGEKPKNNFKSHNGLRTRKWSENSAKLENKNTDKGYKKRLSNDILKFSEVGQTEKTSDIRDYDQGDNEFGNLQVFFEIDNGLGRELGNKTVPAFVTYELVVKKENYPGESPIFCNVRGTIQGLLASSDSYKWCHAITYGVSGQENSDTTLEVKCRIIDTDADTNNGRIRVRGVGYNHFTNAGQNQTENLVSEA